jgi:6-phosphofructokinase 1
MIRKIALLTSGGDAPGMNAAIRSVVRTAMYNNIKVLGFERGYQGLIDNSFYEMNMTSVSDIIQRGGTILKTARCESFKTKEGQKYASFILDKNEIDALVVIGGDGSFRGAWEIQKLGVKVIGIPGTIDNDVYGTEYTIGFDTAVDTVVSALNKIRDTASSHERTFVVECMGRNSGWIALTAGIAGGAEDILIPERDFSYQETAKKIKDGFNRGKAHGIIVLSEGVEKSDVFSEKLEQHLGMDVNRIVLGHIQRGGNPSSFDKILASKLGYWAVEELLKSNHGNMIGVQGNQKVLVPFKETSENKKMLDDLLYEMAEVLNL